MLLDAVVRVVMAYTLPMDLVPGLGAVLWPVTLVLLQLVNGVYYEVAGLWRLTARHDQALAGRLSARPCCASVLCFSHTGQLAAGADTERSTRKLNRSLEGGSR